MPTGDKTDKRSRRNKLTLLGALLVALAGVTTYNLIQSRKYDVQPKTRAAFDFVVTWRCLDCGHTLQDNAGIGPRECPQCGQPQMYMSIDHACRVHGVFPVAFQYDERGSPTEVKVADGPWVPQFRDQIDLEDEDDSGYNVLCPKCGSDLYPVAP